MGDKRKVLVIGSGVGGLSCGVALARLGMEVHVLEQHSVPGGFIQSFKHRKWKFNIGTHYVSNMDYDNQNNRVFNNITGQKLKYKNMDDVYEKIIFRDGSTYNVLADKEKYISQLISDFPEDKKGIINFFSMIDNVARNTRIIVAPRLFSGFLNKLLLIISFFKTLTTRYKTLADVIEHNISNKRLGHILSLHCGKILSSPDRVSFQAFSIVKNSYFYGGSYPAGSGDSIVNSIISELNRLGGTVECNKHVENIIVNKNRIFGVKLKTGEVIKADIVVSNTGIMETYEKLISGFEKSRRYNNLKQVFRPSYSYITLFIGLKGDLSKFNIGNTNYRIISDTPFDFCNDPTADNYSPNYFTVVFPSLRDLNHEDSEHHTAEIFIPTTYEYFENWSNSGIGRRGDEYKTLKENLTDMMLSKLNELFPDITEQVEYTSLSTPLTNRDYILRNAGATYGVETIPEKMTSNLLHPKSDIKGLYFTGADIFLHGIIGTCLGGIITASSVAKKNLLPMFS